MKIFKHPLILETACGHDGKEKNLKILTDIAIHSNAKIIKYQIFNLDERSNENSYERKIFEKLVLEEKSWERIIKYSKRNKLITLADVYGEYSLGIAQNNGVHGFKIHSEDFFNSYFIEKVINIGKPVLINLGGTFKSEVFNLLDYLKRKKKLSKKIFLMHGVQTFPTPIEGHSLFEFKQLIENYKYLDVNFGYSDHLSQNHPMNFYISIIAYTLGASLIEKHFTDNLKFKRTDYQSALDKKNLLKFLNIFNQSIKLQKRNLSHFKYENIYRKMFKKTCVLKNDVSKNQIIKFKDLSFQKNNTTNSHFFSIEIH